MFLVLLLIGGSILFGLVALIAGIVALVRINRSEGKLRGKGFAVAAIVIGLLMLLALPVFGVVGAGFFWRSSVRKPPSVRHGRAYKEPGMRGVKKTLPEYEEKKESEALEDSPEAK